MKSRFLRPKALAATIATALAGSAITAITSFATQPGVVDDAQPTAPRGNVVNLATATPVRYIVRFAEPPLAEYNIAATSGASISGIGKIPTKTMPNGRVRLDVRSAAATAYVQYVKNQQTQHLSDISTALKQTVPVRYSMQHALNAVVMELTPKQAETVGKVQGVVAVERDYPHPLATDIGPGFIGASSVWWGTPAGQDSFFANGFDNTGGFFGDGIVVGDIDTGYNSLSPSFQPTDVDGYTVSNPLGSGNFLGQCNLGSGASGISLAGCNDKVIGVYDEIDLTDSDPPFGGHYSVEDTQGHGSHTASTAAGDQRIGTLAGYTARLSGVAPHANLVIYYACSPKSNIQCSTAATSAAVDQAIQDGVVDALNYSISGGSTPWQDSTSLAFLSASDAGIFIAAAAGNTGTSVPNQLPGTANHAEPWVTTVAAATHTGGAIAPDLSATGPGTPPANVHNQPLTEGSGDVPPTATITASLALSPQFNASTTTGSDGCSAYPANLFAGDIALVSRGTCTFAVKVANATAAGAIAVIISDNRVEAPLTVSVPGATLPVYSLTQAQGLAFQSFLAGNSNVVPAVIPFPPIRQPAQPDVLANFSLLGPVTIDVIKPDVQAPGVNILAAFADAASDNPNLVALDNGTSMATPHTTGSGALMLGLHPDWSPEEARSALMMTAKEAGLTKADGTTPSDYFDRGSGRLQDYPASNAGLVLDETGLNFANADPSISGDPSSLNLASMQSAECIDQCSFTRKFHSTQDHTVTWTPSVAAGSDAGLTVTFSATSFPATAHHDAAPITFHVDSHAVASDGKFHFAEVVLTPSDSSLTPLHLPIAVAVPPPTIAAAPNPLSITGVGAASATGTLTVSNVGGPTLNVTQNTTTVSTPNVWNNQPSNDAFGYTSVQYSGLGGQDTDFFASDDFTITGASAVNLTQIRAPGFFESASSTATLSNTATMIHWCIYTDAGGQPSSNPDAAGPAVFSADLAPNATGVSLTGGTYHAEIDLNLTAAGLSTNLSAGHYWLVVYATLPCADSGNGCTNAWLWLNSTTGSGSSAVNIAPQSATPTWSAIDSNLGAGFAMHLESNVSCVPPTWLSVASGLPAAINGNSSAPVIVQATAPLGATSATAYLCLNSNDAKTPLLPVQVNAAQ